MERIPLLKILQDMEGTALELDLLIHGDEHRLEIRNVISVEPLESTHGMKVTTRQNYIWIDASHVSAAWQARSDIE